MLIVIRKISIGVFQLLDDRSNILFMMRDNVKMRGRTSKNGLPFEDTRTLLIQRALELWTERGFNGTGLSELLKGAGVPKGSFYHYFASKEDFAQAVIESYSDYLSNKLETHFAQTGLSPMKRLKSFVTDAEQGLEKYEFRRGCLVGNLGQELAGMDASLRLPLSEAFSRWEKQLTHLLLEAQLTGELAEGLEAGELAKFFWMGWEGAILRARLERSAEPLRSFTTQFFNFCSTG